MRISKLFILIMLVAACLATACKQKTNQDKTALPVVYKGLYSIQERVKIFQECNKKAQILVEDSAANLELKYTQLVGSDKIGQTVYIEVKGIKAKSMVDGYDSTLVVTQVLSVNKDLPADCN